MLLLILLLCHVAFQSDCFFSSVGLDLDDYLKNNKPDFLTLIPPDTQRCKFALDDKPRIVPATMNEAFRLYKASNARNPRLDFVVNILNATINEKINKNWNFQICQHVLSYYFGDFTISDMALKLCKAITKPLYDEGQPISGMADVRNYTLPKYLKHTTESKSGIRMPERNRTVRTLKMANSQTLYVYESKIRRDNNPFFPVLKSFGSLLYNMTTNTTVAKSTILTELHNSSISPYFLEKNITTRGLAYLFSWYPWLPSNFRVNKLKNYNVHDPNMPGSWIERYFLYPIRMLRYSDFAQLVPGLYLSQNISEGKIPPYYLLDVQSYPQYEYVNIYDLESSFTMDDLDLNICNSWTLRYVTNLIFFPIKLLFGNLLQGWICKQVGVIRLILSPLFFNQDVCTLEESFGKNQGVCFVWDLLVILGLVLFFFGLFLAGLLSSCKNCIQSAKTLAAKNKAIVATDKIDVISADLEM